MNKKHNVKSRKVYCSRGHNHWWTNEPNPKCKICGEPAITIVKSNDELVKRLS